MAFFKSEAASGIVLLLSALAAILVVNFGPVDAYHSGLAFSVGPLSIADWINDGLMAIFFFIVGMEIKAELTTGALASRDRAVLPIAGALGGMIVPALVFLIFARGSSFVNGWGIPMATDIAFAVGVLALFGSRIPSQLKIFLLALAIVDDLGAVLVIALFYTATLHLWALVAAVAVGAVIWKSRWIWLNVLLGIGVWWLVHHSGIHATIAGCALGFLVREPRLWAARLHAWSSYLIMPLFAFANAGLSFGGEVSLTAPLVSAISYGLLIGKPLGIFAAAGIAVKCGFARLDFGWWPLLGVACLGGIGFTMSLFIGSLALNAHDLEIAKLGIVKGSLLSALLGSFVLALATRRKVTPQ